MGRKLLASFIIAAGFQLNINIYDHLAAEVDGVPGAGGGQGGGDQQGGGAHQVTRSWCRYLLFLFLIYSPQQG